MLILNPLKMFQKTRANFRPLTFVLGDRLRFFQQLRTLHQILRFMMPGSNFEEKNFLLTLKPKTDKTAQKKCETYFINVS
jgi:hypothetical protein